MEISASKQMLNFAVALLFLGLVFFVFRAYFIFWYLIMNLKANFPDVYKQFMIKSDSTIYRPYYIDGKLFMKAFFRSEEIFENEEFREISLEKRLKIYYNLKIALWCLGLLFLIFLVINPLYLVYFVNK